MSRSLGVLSLDLIAKTGGFEAGMDKAARVADKKTRQIERQAQQRAKAIEAAWKKMAGGIAAAWGAIKLVDSVRAVIDLQDEFQKLSIRTGVTVRTLSELNYAASLNDATLQDLGNGLKDLSTKMLAAQSGSAEAGATFKALGISVTDSTGKLRPAEEVLLDIADAFSKMQDGAGKSAIANKLMADSGIRLIPTLNQGREGIEAMSKEAAQFGAVVTDEAAAAAAEFKDNLEKLQTVGRGFAMEIGNTVIPSLNALATEFLTARKAGLSFLEALVGIGILSDPTKGPIEQIARLDKELEKLAKRRAETVRLLGGREDGSTLLPMIDTQIARLQKEREYFRILSEPDAPTLPVVTVTAPTLPTTGPTTPSSKAKAKDDPLTDAAKAYAEALQFLNGAQLAAHTSGLDLTATQQRLVEIMSNPTFAAMPESWRVMVAEQGAYVIETERAAAETQRLNELLAATPTEQLERQRETMQFLADAFEQGRQSAEQFSEAASTALGNVPLKVEEASGSFLDLTLVANDAANRMAGAFGSFFSGQETNVKDMLASFLKAIAEMIAQALILKAIQAGLGAMGVPGFKDGAGFDKTGPVKPFASGGVVDSPQFFKFASGGSFRTGVMGEAGPEAILPLKRGADGKLGVTMNGGGNNAPVVNITVMQDGQTKQEGSGGELAQLAQRIKGVVVQELLTQQRPGGLLYR